MELNKTCQLVFVLHFMRMCTTLLKGHGSNVVLSVNGFGLQASVSYAFEL